MPWWGWVLAAWGAVMVLVLLFFRGARETDSERRERTALYTRYRMEHGPRRR